MGLDAHVSRHHEETHEHLGAYGGYHRWRENIAKAKGFDLNKMEGFGGTESWEGKPFPLVLNHSDCEGEYTFEQIPALMEEIKEIQELGVDDYDQCEKFMRLCEAALKFKKPIVFC